MVSEKYLAGFLDADGSIELICPSEKTKWFYPYVKLSWSQKLDRSAILEMILVDYKMRSRVKTVDGKQYMEVAISGAQANMLLARISKHLVVKRAYAETVLAFVDQRLTDLDEIKRGALVVRAVRKAKAQKMPNYPTRKWLAGFFDGDGCIHADVKYGASARMRAVVSCAEYDRVSAELLQKAFGGSITNREGRKSIVVWELCMDAAKAKKFLGHFEKYSIVKKAQVDYVLRCAATGSFRNGTEIASTLKDLKTHPHRLSEPTAQITV